MSFYLWFPEWMKCYVMAALHLEANGPITSNLSKMAASLNELIGDICEESHRDISKCM